MIRNKLTQTTEGYIFMLFEIIIWSLFPIITILSYSAITPLFAAAFSTLFASIVFGVLLGVKGTWRELKIKAAWLYMLIATIVIGVIYYALYFVGLNSTSAGNASIVALMEIFFSFVVFRIWGKEHMRFNAIGGMILMAFGAIVVLFPKHSPPNIGDLLILLGTVLLPFGNYAAQKARKLVSSSTIMFVRSIISAIFLFGLAFAFEQSPTMGVLQSSIVLLLINGILLLGVSKVLWIEAIHRIPITKATALAATVPALTLVFAYIILGDVPTIVQVLGFLPMFVGVLLLVKRG